MVVWIVFQLTPLPQSFSYGFGSAGKEKFQIPPDAELQYEVKLKSFEKVGIGDEVPNRLGGGEGEEVWVQFKGGQWSP